MPAFLQGLQAGEREYSDYLTELTYGGLEILTVDAVLVEKSIDLGKAIRLADY